MKHFLRLFTTMNLLISMIVCMDFSLYAQVPSGFSFQAVIRDQEDKLVMQQNVGIRIAILQGSSTGTEVYAETHQPQSNAFGLVSFVIGQGDNASSDFDQIDWADGPYYIKTETDPLGGISYSITVTRELLSVPFAMYAANSQPGPPGPPGPAGEQGEQGPLPIIPGSDGQIFFHEEGGIGTDPALVYDKDLGHLSIGTTTNPNAALEVSSTTGAFLPPRMAETARNAIAPQEGMVVFNTTTKKLQVYAENTSQQSIVNEIFTGTFTPLGFLPTSQGFTSPLDGQIVAVEFLIRGTSNPLVDLSITGVNSHFETYSTPENSSWTWHTFVLSVPVQVVNGGLFSVSLASPIFGFLDFATNSFYQGGSGCCFAENDLLFRVHIQPDPGTFSWQNLH
jgi:hypothetical protein